MLCTGAAEDSPQFSSDSLHPPEHLIVLANGILSDPNDWAYFRFQLLEEPGQRFLVYAEKDNVYCKTMGGVDVAGKRLAGGVLEVVKQTPSLRRISFVGHSLGGLFVRYALALLFRAPGRGKSLRTRDGENLETDLDQLEEQEKAAGKSGSTTGYVETDQWGGASWRPSACNEQTTNHAEGTPSATEEPTLPAVGAGLDTPECRLVDSLAAFHNATETSSQPTNPNCQPTKPTFQASQKPGSQLTKRATEANHSQPTNPFSQPPEPKPQPTKPITNLSSQPPSQPPEPKSQTTKPTSHPTEPTSSQPTELSFEPTNRSSQPTNPSSPFPNPKPQPTIAGLEPAHLILVAVPHLGVWGRNQWPFARGVHSFERIASCFSGIFLGRTLRQLFLRDRGVGGEPLLLSMARDCKDQPFVSALGAFKTRHMYANVKWDAALGWKTSCVRLDGDLERVRKECFGRAKEKQWLGERYPYIVHVEDTPGRGVSDRGGALEYVFAPPLVRQMSDAVLSALKGKRGGEKKGLELDGLTVRMEDDSDRTIEGMDGTENGTEKMGGGTERTENRTERTGSGLERAGEDLTRTDGRPEREGEGAERAEGGTERTDAGTERTVGSAELTVVETGTGGGKELVGEGTERTVERTEWTEGGTAWTEENGTEQSENAAERTEDGAKRTASMRTARGKLRTHRWSSEAACRALADRMVTGLHQVSWRKVDVMFYGAPGRKYAHQMLIMKEPRPQAAGQGVVNHMMDVLCGRM